MKNYLRYSIILVLFAMFSSCGDSDDDMSTGNGMPSDDYHLTLTIDGTELTTSNATVSFGANITGLFIITGTGLGGEDSNVTLSLKSPASEGTFTLSEENAILSYVSGASVWPANIDDGPATIIISENTSEHMIGTFSFTGSNPADDTIKVITEGSFKAEKL